jgi:hypothetical protein
MLEKRATPSVMALSKPYREKFLSIFQGCTLVLIGIWGADMRLKPLQETHAEHFLKWFQSAFQTAEERAAARKAAAKEVANRKPGSSQSKPE